MKNIVQGNKMFGKIQKLKHEIKHFLIKFGTIEEYNLQSTCITFGKKNFISLKILLSLNFLYDYQLWKNKKIPIKSEKKWETIFNNMELNWPRNTLSWP